MLQLGRANFSSTLYKSIDLVWHRKDFKLRMSKGTITTDLLMRFI